MTPATTAATTPRRRRLVDRFLAGLNGGFGRRHDVRRCEVRRALVLDDDLELEVGNDVDEAHRQQDVVQRAEILGAWCAPDRRADATVADHQHHAGRAGGDGVAVDRATSTAAA